MKRKRIMYIIIGIIILLIGFFIIGNINGKTTKNTIEENNQLSKYRSSEIPEKCRLPDYENNLELWKQHLSHHKETLYCLDYYN